MSTKWINVYNAVKKSGASIKVVPTRPVNRIVKSTTVSKVVPITNFTYILNDASKPITKTITMPVVPMAPKFQINGYVGSVGANNPVPYQAANIFVTIANTLNYIKSISPIDRWAATSSLTVIPRAGRALNAYYDRTSLRFFYDINPRTGNLFYLSDSTDVVAHELGHAILDSFRPDLYNSPYMETWAFHEAFGDFMSFVNMLQHDEVINVMLAESNSNLKNDNLACKIAEEVGNIIAVYDSSQSSLYLRDINNNYVWSNPTTLPTVGPRNMLTAQPHSFSRIMSGTLYDVFVMIYEDLVSKGNSRVNAIKSALNITVRYLIKSVQNVIVEPRFYKRVAHGMLWADFISGNVYNDRMRDIFKNRNLVSDFDALSVDTSTSSTIRLTEFTESGKELHCCSIHIPHFHPSVIEEVKKSVEYLEGLENPPFVIENGFLARKHFMCGCACKKPRKDAPEFGKEYKPQSNTGCGCQSKKTTTVESKPAVKRSCAVRYKTF